jgi:hypothetical protein
MNGHQRRAVGTMRDISATGVFFYADFRPDKGSRLELILMLPPELTHAEALPIMCVGTVVRVEPDFAVGKFGIAVEIETYQNFKVA